MNKTLQVLVMPHYNMKKKHISKSYSFKTDQRVPIEWLLIITYRTGVIRGIIIPVIIE